MRLGHTKSRLGHSAVDSKLPKDDSVKNLVVQDIRCFHSEMVVPLAPLTLLVGENSAGKSTFLAATRLAWDIAHGNFQPDFNEEPFPLGAYDQIANLRGGRGGRAESFSIGFEFTAPKKLRMPHETRPPRVRATFVQGGAQPHATEWTCGNDSYSLAIDIPIVEDGKRHPSKLRVATPSGKFIQNFPHWAFPGPGFDLHMIRYLLSPSARVGPEGTGYQHDGPSTSDAKNPTDQEIESLAGLLSSILQSAPSRPYAMAPIRTEPLRTYHPTRETRRASGAHVPMVLAEMSGDASESWSALKKRLDAFGSESGLFHSLNIKRLGKKVSDPFQLEIKASGKAFNLVDVGYGVSQALPILVDSLMSDHKFFLMQQPEVHLHPKAQAALGSLLGSLVKQDKKRFIVETHSDYILDRIRLDVRDKKSISHEDVLILYFERNEKEVTVHPIHIDARGNVVDAPPCYREFFLSEERRFFGV